MGFSSEMLFCQEDLHYRPPEYDGTCFAVLENRTSWGVIQECDCVHNLIFRVVLMCTFIDVFKLWSEDKPVRGQSFACREALLNKTRVLVLSVLISSSVNPQLEAPSPIYPSYSLPTWSLRSGAAAVPP